MGERHCPEVSESVPRLMLPTSVDIADQSAVFDGLPPFVEATCRWLSAYFSRTSSLPPLPDMEWRGTDFQLAVWRELLAVPFGQTLTYGALATRVAARMGRPSPAIRAVGNGGRAQSYFYFSCRVIALSARAARWVAMRVG